MRWGRGFFRVWLLLSVIWIVVSNYVFEPRTYQFWRAPIFEFKTPGGEQFVVNSSKSREETVSTINEALEREQSAPLRLCRRDTCS